MARGPRRKVDGAFYHVYSRGNRKQVIFIDDRDRRRFLRRLRLVEAATGALRVAHCLMGNHFHILVRPGAGGVSALMHRVLGAYAGGFNRRHAAVGHLFHGRFGSRPLFSEDDLLVVLRYIHHNPVKAGMVPTPSEWEWSSHRAHLTPAPPADLALGVRLVRGILATDRGDERPVLEAYRELMDEPAPAEEVVFPAASGRTGGSEGSAPLPQAAPGPGPRLEAIVERIAFLHGISPEDLAGGSRHGVPVRDVVRLLGCSSAVAYRHLSRREARRAATLASSPSGCPASGSGTEVPER
jgi:REP element-mobilizing transposase RayT